MTVAMPVIGAHNNVKRLYLRSESLFRVLKFFRMKLHLLAFANHNIHDTML